MVVTFCIFVYNYGGQSLTVTVLEYDRGKTNMLVAENQCFICLTETPFDSSF